MAGEHLSGNQRNDLLKDRLTLLQHSKKKNNHRSPNPPAPITNGGVAYWKRQFNAQNEKNILAESLHLLSVDS